MDVKLTEKQRTALCMAILRCQADQRDHPDFEHLQELVADLEPVLALLYRAKAVTVEVEDDEHA